jgi:hypothetical protein
MKGHIRQFVSFIVSFVVFVSMIGCAQTGPKVVPLTDEMLKAQARAQNPTEALIDNMLSDSWYQDFIQQEGRKPVIEVVTFRDQLTDNLLHPRRSNPDLARIYQSNPAIRNVPPDWLPCLDRQSLNKLMQDYRASGRPDPFEIKNSLDPSRLDYSIFWAMDLRTQMCLNNAQLNKLAMQRQLLLTQRRNVVTQMALETESVLIHTRKVHVVSIGDRNILSYERYFSMRHAASNTVQQPGQVRGADFLLEVSLTSFRLLRIKTNEIVWSELVADAKKPFMQPMQTKTIP